MPSGLPEGHSLSAHRAAKPQQRFHVVSAIWVRIVHRLIENGLKGTMWSWSVFARFGFAQK